jgi:phage-related protein
MPISRLFYFRNDDGSVPMVEWLDSLSRKAGQKCVARLVRLRGLGHELRRPEADYLRDGIYELRASFQGVHYRMLYFFHGTAAVIVSHGITKEREVPFREIDLAIRRKALFEEDPVNRALQPRIQPSGD